MAADRSPSRPTTTRISRVRLMDLDDRPELISAAVATFAAHGPGKSHLVCGIPARMAQAPTAADLLSCTGVLVARTTTECLGAIAICPYSDDQVTIWGPAVTGPLAENPVASALLTDAKRHLRKAGFISIRLLVDTRNRELRTWARSQGFSVWKDNLVYERTLRRSTTDHGVRLIDTNERQQALRIIAQAFPEADAPAIPPRSKADPAQRIYILPDPDGTGILGVAQLQGLGPRAWMKLIAIAADHRSHGHGRRLVSGICALENQRGTRSIGLEVLADNQPATRLYQRAGFTSSLKITIMTAPL